MARKSPQTWRFEFIDSMADGAFRGNPTPVFILDASHQDQNFESWPADPVLQAVAREMNQSETIFVMINRNRNKREDAHDGTWYSIRSFTPFKEEVFCGHGIVGASHVLCRSKAHRQGRTMRFLTVGGIVVEARLTDCESQAGFEFGVPRTVMLEIPAEPVTEWFDGDEALRERLAICLNIPTVQILTMGRNMLRDLVIEVNEEVDFSAENKPIAGVALMHACPAGTRSQIITSKGDAHGVDFVKRVFAYGHEDQGTGSTYCVLIPFWASRLGKSSMRVMQISDRTAGAFVSSSAKREGYVSLYGAGVKVMSGEILVPVARHKARL